MKNRGTERWNKTTKILNVLAFAHSRIYLHDERWHKKEMDKKRFANALVFSFITQLVAEGRGRALHLHAQIN